MEDMTNMDGEEFLCYIAGCINESIRSTTFGVATLTQIIDKYAQEAFKFLKEARPDLSLPDKESLLKIVPGLRMVHGGSKVNVESTGALEVPSAGDTAQVVTGGVNADVQITEAEEVARKERRMVIDILDLRAIAKSKHLDLVKRIEVAYFEATIKTDVQFHLMFGQYDVWSVMNIAKSDFSRNKSSVRACEMQLRAFLLLMQDRSTANAHAKSYRLAALEERKKAELKSIDADHFSMDLSEPALALLTALQEEEEEEEGEPNDAHDNYPYHTAAKFAAKELGISTNWINLVKFVQQMKTSMYRDTLGIIMCRVMQMVPFYSVAKCIKNEDTIAFLDKLGNWRDSKRTIADAWDSLIIPSLLDGTPDVDMIEAYRLAVFIAQRLSFQNFEEYFQKAESIPLNKLFEECDAAQCLRRCKSDKRKSYFLAEDSNAQVKSVLARSRRLTATRSFLISPTFTSAMQKLRARGLFDDGDGDVSTSVFGVNCMAASKFVNPKYKLLWDEERLIKPQRGDEKCIWSLIEDTSGLGEKAAKVFEGDYIILDLARDMKEESSKTLERLNEYFRLCIPSDSSEGIEV